MIRTDHFERAAAGKAAALFLLLFFLVIGGGPRALADPIGAGPVVLMPASFTLDPPGPAAPGINHLDIDVTVGSGILSDSDSDQTRIAGTLNAILEVDLTDPNAPVMTGVQFTGGSFDTLDPIELSFFIFLLANVDVISAGIGGTVSTPSGRPEPVITNAFDLMDHSIILNEGTFVASGTALGNPVNENIDLGASPLTANGMGSGNTTITRAATGPLVYTYDTTINIPIAIDETVPLDDAGTLTARIQANGTIALTGKAHCLPALTSLGRTGTGFEIELVGNEGDIVDLCWSDNLTDWTYLDTITLDSDADPTKETYCDPAGLTETLRFYKIQAPAAP